MKVKRGVPWTPYNRATFYGPKSSEGYLDYPFFQDCDGVDAEQGVEKC